MSGTQYIAKLTIARKRILAILTGPPALAFVPAFSLAAFWFGGEGALLVVAAILPVLYLMSLPGAAAPVPASTAGQNTLQDRQEFINRLDRMRTELGDGGLNGCVYVLKIEQAEEIEDLYGRSVCIYVADRVAERLNAAMRQTDAVARLDLVTFAICAGPVARLPLEQCVQMAVRLQSAAEDAVALDGTVIYPNASIGFCQSSRAPGTTGEEWLTAANEALGHAQSRGASTIKAFTDHTPRTRGATKRALGDEISQALRDGEIAPWFQPQLSTETGQISGFEALARWRHPVRGVLNPSEFLPAIEEAGRGEELLDVILLHSFHALRAWDDAGVHIPSVGVNFSGGDLSNPQITEKVAWDLDRFDLTAERLTVEILETVVSNAPEDVVCRNIKALQALGCGIDLDDFGSGSASFMAVRRFAIRRLKIDRSFVSHADRDPEQQRVIGAILKMAERLDLETIAEGVETVGEHTLLAQLGCHHVQGFGIARPMPFEQTLDWINSHQAKLKDVPQITQTRQK